MEEDAVLQNVLRDANEFSRRLQPVKFILTYFIYLLTLSLSHCSISKLLGVLSQNRRKGFEFVCRETTPQPGIIPHLEAKRGVQG